MITEKAKLFKNPCQVLFMDISNKYLVFRLPRRNLTIAAQIVVKKVRVVSDSESREEGWGVDNEVAKKSHFPTMGEVTILGFKPYLEVFSMDEFSQHI